MKQCSTTRDLILANLLFGVSYSVVVSLLERSYTPDQLFVSQLIIGVLIYLPHLDIAKLRAHLPHLLRNTIILLYGWQRLTLIGSKETPPLTIAAISIIGIVVTLTAARNLHWLRIFCTPLVAVILTLPHTNIQGEWMILCGVICVAISTVLSRDMVLTIGTSTLLSGYFTIGLIILPILIPHSLRLPHDTTELLPLLYQTTLGSALPLYLLLQGSAHTTPLQTALSRYLQSVVTVVVFYFWRK